MPNSALKPATTYTAVIGRVLCVLREQKGLGQTELASAVGVMQSTWSRIEKGASSLNVEQLAKAAAVLKVRPADVLACVTESVQNLERQGVKVEYVGTSRVLGEGVVMIKNAELQRLVLVRSKSEQKTGKREAVMDTGSQTKRNK